eukprot:maker-scaffold_54-snap-gene-0.44-mRNA-1 protein AED:0.41 eAED:0.42 QI:0/0/0/1/0/0/3/0/152
MNFKIHVDGMLTDYCEAKNREIREAGIHLRLCDIGEAIQEVMRPREIELDAKVYQVKRRKNINGHYIEQYNTLGEETVPIVKGGGSSMMEQAKYDAIDNLGKTGSGYVVDDMDCSHYMKKFYAHHVSLRTQGAKKLLNHIHKTFGILAFCNL